MNKTNPDQRIEESINNIMRMINYPDYRPDTDAKLRAELTKLAESARKEIEEKSYYILIDLLATDYINGITAVEIANKFKKELAELAKPKGEEL